MARRTMLLGSSFVLLAAACSLLTSLDGLTGGTAEDGGTASDGASSDAAADAAPDTLTCPDAAAYATDPKHCGRCAHDCLGGSCSNGVCQSFELARVTPLAIGYLKVDASYVYFSDSVAGTVLRVPKTGGPTETLATGLPGAGLSSIDDDYVYFISAVVQRVHKNGIGAVETIASIAVGDAVVDQAFLYFAEYNQNDGGSLYRSAKTGGPTTVLASNLRGVEAIAPSAGDVFFGENGSVPPGTVRVARAGGGVQTLATSAARRIAVDATHAYWISYLSPDVQRIAREGGPSMVVSTAPVNAGAGDIALDDENVYWAATPPDGGAVFQATKAGGTQIRIAPSSDGPTGVAVDDRAIYFSLSKTGQLMLRAK